jgi:lipopolysaccharide export system protein LptA
MLEMQDLCPTKTMPHPAPTFAWQRPLAVALSGLLLVSAAAHAEQADKDKPMNIEADALRYDDTTQTSVFSGNVSITKGTIIMRGAKIEVRQDTQGNQFGVLVGTAKAPSFFRQKREGVDEWVEGEGEKLDYDSKAQTVVFTGNATLRRYRGTQLNDESVGSQIVYNSQTEVFTVKGGTQNASPSNPSGRVRAMLTPIPKDGAAAAAPTSEPAKLRPSGKIGENAK